MNSNVPKDICRLLMLFFSILIISGCSSSSDSESSANTSTMGDEQDFTVDSDALESVQPTLELVADKTILFNWQPSTGAQFYRVLENPDGVSGFSQISEDLASTVQTFRHRVALFARVNAQYIVQACDAIACVDSETLSVTGSLESGIQKFSASNAGVGDEFGHALSLSADGTTMVIGARFEDSGATGLNGDQEDNSTFNAGAAYVFTRIDGNWVQEAYLKASNTTSIRSPSQRPNEDLRADNFADSISLSADGDTLAIAAPREGNAGTGVDADQKAGFSNRSGAVYIFTRSDGAWQQESYVKASNSRDFLEFGNAISLSSDGNTLAVGAKNESSAATGIGGDQSGNAASSSGAVYVFARSDGSWAQQEYIKASNSRANGIFGDSVSLNSSGNTLVVGSPGEASNAIGVNGNQSDFTSSSSGAVYVFSRNAGIWQQDAYLKASNSDAADLFGRSVATSGDGRTIVVGSVLEDSQSAGVNGDQSDNSASAAGAAYVFSNSSGEWQQQAYLKASNPDVDDSFGIDVSLSSDGNTLAVSADDESSSASGINGDQSDNSAVSAGAVYVFVRTSGEWQQTAYVKASDTTDSDRFSSVSLSADGNSLAVGAPENVLTFPNTGGSDQASDTSGLTGSDFVHQNGAIGTVHLY